MGDIGGISGGANGLRLCAASLSAELDGFHIHI